MTTISPNPKFISPKPTAWPQLSQPTASPKKVISIMQSSLLGLIGWLTLMAIGFFPLQQLPSALVAFLFVSAFLLISLTTGLLATALLDRQLESSQQAGEIGWMAGFWAGIGSAVFAMLLAASGNLMPHIGANLSSIHIWGLSPETIALLSRVIAAFIVYGLIGPLIFGLFSALGGLIYFQFRQ